MNTKTTLEQNFFTDERLYPSTEQLRQLFNSSSDIICTINLDKAFVHINACCYTLLGYNPQEMAGRNVLDFVFEEDKEKTEAAGYSVIQGNTQVNFENRYHKKDGNLVTLSWSCKWDAREKLTFCIGRDVTERKTKEALHAQYEEKLKGQHRLMIEMLDRITDGFFALDQDWHFIYGNTQVEKMLGIKMEDYLTRNYWECFPQMVDSVYFEKFQLSMREKVEVHFKEYFPPFNRWFSVDVYPSNTGLSVFFRDISEQVKAEAEREQYRQKIEQQHNRLSNILERMNQGFFALDNEFRVRAWNKKAEEIIGLTKEMTLGKVIGEFYNQEALDLYTPLFARAIKERALVTSEHLCPQNGRWTEIEIFPSEEGFFVFFKDVHEQKQIQEEIRKLSLIAQETMNAVIVTDLQHKISWVNEAFTKITGYSLDEVLGKNIGELLDCPEADPGTLAFIRKQIQQGNCFQAQILNRTKDNGRVWWEVYYQPIHNDNGEVVQYFSICADITDRKRAEEELKKLSLIAENTVNAVAISDAQGKVLWINKSAETLTGYSYEEVIGTSISVICDGPETDPETIRHVQACREQQVPFHIEVLNYKKNGETYWADISSQPLFDEAGNLKYYFSISTDINERKTLERELNAQRKKTTAAVIAAQEKERAQVGRELHDNVNQVLTSVKLYQDLILSGIGDKEELLRKSTDLLQQSIDEIRSLSKRLSAPTLGNIRLKDSVKELVDTIAATKKFDVLVDTEVIEELDVTEELHLALYRILQEHFTNILKYAEASTVQVIFDIGGNELWLTVKDNGKGFDTAQKSSGIGITNMTIRAESLNGQLLINSAPAKGCELVVRVPLTS